jgi:hypothetical protein
MIVKIKRAANFCILGLLVVASLHDPVGSNILEKGSFVYKHETNEPNQSQSQGGTERNE